MRRPARGFTLIELMVVVALIGILSSIALPSFRNYQLRTKQAEKHVITRAIKDAMNEYLTRHDQYPNGTAAASWIRGYYAPPLPAQPIKRPLRSGVADDWAKLNLVVQGNVFHTYYFYATVQTSWRQAYVLRYADLDGDNRSNYSYEHWYSSPTSVNGRTVWVEYNSPYDDFPWNQTF